ncbi:MAG TPA: hypothetical protein QF698_05830 [Candidatus Marinimicrobia bacterium]|jgi:hypothetical protein|nr:hypothetical protein [Candidatus Neomarinimicrobiota bacterium]|tara:strand:+ start:1347 stop:1724 length:378 start_codon:yes stop_codon:yes gene_type:complete
MNKTNIFLMTLGLTLLSAFSQAADQEMQIKDLGIDGENRLYDLVCSNGNATTLFHRIGLTDAPTEMLPPDDETINIESLDTGPDDAGYESGDKPQVCTAIGGGELDCAEYKDIDTAAEAICKKLG